MQHQFRTAEGRVVEQLAPAQSFGNPQHETARKFPGHILGSKHA